MHTQIHHRQMNTAPKRLKKVHSAFPPDKLSGLTHLDLSAWLGPRGQISAAGRYEEVQDLHGSALIREACRTALGRRFVHLVQEHVVGQLQSMWTQRNREMDDASFIHPAKGDALRALAQNTGHRVRDYVLGEMEGSLKHCTAYAWALASREAQMSSEEFNLALTRLQWAVYAIQSRAEFNACIAGNLTTPPGVLLDRWKALSNAYFAALDALNTATAGFRAEGWRYVNGAHTLNSALHS